MLMSHTCVYVTIVLSGVSAAAAAAAVVVVL